MVFLENLIGPQVVMKFVAFYGTRRFITAFTTARHLSLCWVKLIKRTSFYPLSWRSILILSSSLRLSSPSGVFLLSSPSEPCLSFSHSFSYPTRLFLLDLICSLNNYFCPHLGHLRSEHSHATVYRSTWLLSTRINIDQGICSRRTVHIFYNAVPFA